MEKHYRSLLKSISWRITGTIDTIIISFLVTGKIRFALSIGGIEVVSKIILYYTHERIWASIPLGIKTATITPAHSSKTQYQQKKTKLLEKQ